MQLSERFLELRPARPDDIETVYVFWSEAVKPYVGPYIASHFNRPWEDEGEKLRFSEWFQPDASALILLDGAPIGWLASEEAEKITLHNFCIASVYRGRGAGRIILQEKMKEWKPKQKTIAHSVLKGCKHAPFFERLGFRAVGEDDLVQFLEVTPARISAG